MTDPAQPANGTMLGLLRIIVQVMFGILGVLMLGLLGWAGAKIIDHEGRISAIEATLPLKTASRYTSEDAARDRGEYTRRLDQLDQAIRDMRNKPKGD